MDVGVGGVFRLDGLLVRRGGQGGRKGEALAIVGVVQRLEKRERRGGSSPGTSYVGVYFTLFTVARRTA